MAEAPAPATTAPIATALVIGGNRGLGLELVKQLLGLGVSVIATARKIDDVEYMKGLNALKETAGDKLTYESVDLNDVKSIALLSEKMSDKSIDQLWVNSGMGGRQTDKGWGVFGDLDADDMSAVYQTNGIGAMLLIQALYECVKRSTNKLKAVCGISSHFGSVSMLTDTFAPPFAGIPYRMSKSAFTMGLAILYEGTAKTDGVRVLPMTPNHVKTDMGTDYAPNTVDDAAKGLIEFAFDAKYNFEYAGFYDGIKGPDFRWTY